MITAAKTARRKRGVKSETHHAVPHLDCGADAAIYYGFIPSESPEIKKGDLEVSKSMLEGDFVEDECGGEGARLPLHVEEKVSILRTFSERGMLSGAQPAMLHFKGHFKGSLAKKGGYPRFCDLEVLGVSKSIAEAALIRTAITILREEGHENLGIEVNSIGDKDAVFKFTRELGNYYRKNIEDLPAHCRQTFKKDPLELLACNNPKCNELKDAAPKSISFLSESSREHLRELLEHIETFDVPYEINHHLVGNKRYSAETIYRIVSLDPEAKEKKKILALGVRYDGLSKRIGLKKEIPGAGISLLIKKSGDEKKGPHLLRKPSIFFIQLGFEARLLSFRVIEALRRAKIRVLHCLGREKLVAQLGVAEKHPITHTILIGKKEAMENSVIVRDMSTRSQETVLIEELAEYLRKLKI